MKKFFKYLSFLLVLPFLVFVTNIMTGTHRSDFNKQFVHDLILNDSLTIKASLDERQIVKSRINYQEKFKKTIVIGSSRSLLIGKPINLKVENYSMSGAIVNDFENVYSELKNKGVYIDTVFVEISPWIFNENTTESRYRDFNVPPLRRKIKKLLSVRYLIDNLNPYKYFPVKNERDFVRYSDGTIKYNYEYQTQNNLKSMKRSIDGEVYHLENFNLIETLNSNRLINLIENMIKDGVVPVLVKHPYPPLISQQILKKYPNTTLSEKIIDSLIIKYNLKSFGSFNPKDVNLNDNDYYDGMHLKPIGVKKLLDVKR